VFQGAGTSCVPSPCNPGDADNDGGVGVNDLLAVITAWGPCPEKSPEPCYADINVSGDVEINDLLIVVVNWGN